MLLFVHFWCHVFVSIILIWLIENELFWRVCEDIFWYDSKVKFKGLVHFQNTKNPQFTRPHVIQDVNVCLSSDEKKYFFFFFEENIPGFFSI